MNIFYNHDEDRMRAGWRLAAQFFLMYLIGFGLLLLLSQFYAFSGNRWGILAIAIGAVISITLAAKGLDKRPWADYGLHINKTWMAHCAAGFALAGAVMGLIFAIEYAAGLATVTTLGWHQSDAGSFTLGFLGYFLFMIVVGFYEELLFRGYQIVNVSEGLNLPNLPRKQAVILAVVLSSFIFGIAHFFNPNANWISTLNVAFAGAMLAFPFVITGRLSLSIGLHIGWNFFQGGIFGFSVSGIQVRSSLLHIQQNGPNWLTGGLFGPEGGLMGLLGIGLIVLVLVWYFSQSDQPLSINPDLGSYEPSPRNYPI